MKIVPDSNVWISAFIAKAGICSDVIQLIINNHECFINSVILKEVSDILVKKIRMKSREVTVIKNYLGGFSVSARNSEKKSSGIICRDIADQEIIDFACQHADVLISGDQNILSLKKSKKIIITSPRNFYLQYK